MMCLPTSSYFVNEHKQCLQKKFTSTNMNRVLKNFVDIDMGGMDKRVFVSVGTPN